MPGLEVGAFAAVLQEAHVAGDHAGHGALVVEQQLGAEKPG
jgi:hypothetical protein